MHKTNIRQTQRLFSNELPVQLLPVRLPFTTGAPKDTAYESIIEHRDIATQAKAFTKLFPWLNPKTAPGVTDRALAAGAEGWYAIPRPEAVGETYEGGLLALMRELRLQRRDRFFCETPLAQWIRGKVPAGHAFSLDEEDASAWQAVCEQQRGYDIIVLPLQLGRYYQGRSPIQARHGFAPDEFSLCPAQIISILLTHPERLQFANDLSIDCLARRHRFAGEDGEGGNILSFSVGQDGQMELKSCSAEEGHDWAGVATGFIPE